MINPENWRRSEVMALAKSDPGQAAPQPVVGPDPSPFDERAELDRLLAADEIYSAFQPVVDLDTGATVGYEALARVISDTPLKDAQLLFESARRTGQLARLDRACQRAAFAGAATAGLRAPWTLFVNVEPECADGTMLAIPDTWHSAKGDEAGVLDFQVVVELTERDLIARPAALLALVARIRLRGWGIALDDVGADRESLALLPLLRPDVIKLDLKIVQERPTMAVAEIVSAVNAEAERSGTTILAEGIESEDHLNIALAMGATLGQGWLLGRPVALPQPAPAFTGTPVRVDSGGGHVSTLSPFAMVTAHRQPRRSRKALLIEISKHLEEKAMSAGESAVVVSTFQHSEFFTPATRRRYARLAGQAAFVGALGEGMAARPMPGVRGCVLDAGDPLLGEWDIAVVGPDYAATLVARDLGDDGPDRERRFEFVLSHNRELALSVALALMGRVWPDD
jgi:EAL domain-containing protein (putative c-di-GMP-specific phosphodiesterase class I)